MQFLSTSIVIYLHKDLNVQFGGLIGIRDKRLLESALAYPQLLCSIGTEQDLYILAAAYCYHLIANHPFVDGNKRIGALAMLVFLRINGVLCRPSKDELYNFAIGCATSQISEEKIASILKLTQLQWMFKCGKN